MGLTLVLLGCNSDSTAVANRIPSTGTYSYYFKPGGPGISPTPYQGKLVLTYATADSIGGLVYARNTKRRTALGDWNLDAYVLYTSGATVGFTNSHRISIVGAPNELACEGRHLVASGSGGINSFISECRLTWESTSIAPLISATGDWSGESAQGYLSLQLEESGGSVTGSGFWGAKVGAGNPVSRSLFPVTGTMNGSTLTLTMQGGSAGTAQLTAQVGAETMSARLTGGGFSNVLITLSVRE